MVNYEKDFLVEDLVHAAQDIDLNTDLDLSNAERDNDDFDFDSFLKTLSQNKGEHSAEETFNTQEENQTEKSDTKQENSTLQRKNSKQENTTNDNSQSPNQSRDMTKKEWYNRSKSTPIPATVRQGAKLAPEAQNRHMMSPKLGQNHGKDKGFFHRFRDLFRVENRETPLVVEGFKRISVAFHESDDSDDVSEELSEPIKHNDEKVQLP